MRVIRNLFAKSNPKENIKAMIVSDLKKIGFVPAFRTMGKLQELQKRELEKYNAYLDLFKQIHESLNMPSIVLKLILPDADLLVKHFEVSILKDNVDLLRRNFITASKKVLDLRKLDTLYPELSPKK